MEAFSHQLDICKLVGLTDQVRPLIRTIKKFNFHFAVKWERITELPSTEDTLTELSPTELRLSEPQVFFYINKKQPS